MNKWVGQCPVIFFSNPSQQWICGTYQWIQVRSDKASLTVLNLLLCNLPKRKRKSRKSSQDQQGWGLFDEPIRKRKRCSTDFGPLFLTFWETRTLIRSTGRDVFDPDILYQECLEFYFYSTSGEKIKHVCLGFPAMQGARFSGLALKHLNVTPVYILSS